MNSSKRYLSIDLLKGIGMIYLFFLHHTVWIFIKNDSGELVYPEAYSLVFNFCHSILGHLGLEIPLLAGATYFISLTRKKSKFIEVLGRVVALIGLGFLMNYLAWGLHKDSFVDDLFDWDVLQFVALSMVVAYPFIKFLPEKAGIGALLGLGLLTLSISNKFPFADLQDSYFYSIFIGDVQGENYWPFCPWFMLFAWGILVGKVLCLEKDSALKKLAGVGGLFIIFSMLSRNFLPPTNIENIWGPALFKPSAVFVVGIMGLSSVMISLISIALKKFPDIHKWLEQSFLIHFGKSILWIYLISTIIGYNITYMVSIKYELDFPRALAWLPFLILVNISVSLFLGKLMLKRKLVAYRQ